MRCSGGGEEVGEDGEIVCLAFFEAHGNSGVVVKRQLEQLIKKLGDDPLVRVENRVIEDVIKEKEVFFVCSRG